MTVAETNVDAEEPARRAQTGSTAPARSRPDPRPARLMVGAGAAAALALIANGLVTVPSTSDAAASAPDAASRARPRPARVKQRLRYVRLKPGQKAPPGAKVIREAAPAPRVVVRLVPSSRSVRTAPVQRKVVTRTRQSGG
jgi:hypothetical protein